MCNASGFISEKPVTLQSVSISTHRSPATLCVSALFFPANALHVLNPATLRTPAHVQPEARLSSGNTKTNSLAMPEDCMRTLTHDGKGLDCFAQDYEPLLDTLVLRKGKARCSRSPID